MKTKITKKKVLRIKKTKIILFILFSFSKAVNAQPQNIIIDNNQSNKPNEPSIIISRQNTNNILAGSNINNLYESKDGGLNWTKTKLYSNYGIWGDPSLNVDTNGNFYFFHLSNPTFGNWVDRIVCQKIVNGTSTIDSYAGLNGAKVQDKPWSVVNYKTNKVYLTWTQFDNYGSSNHNDSSIILFSKSNNGGKNWTTPKRISKFAGNCLDSDSTVEGAVPAIGQNGELYVAWAFNNAIYFNKSTDDGDSWLNKEKYVCSQIGGWDLNIPGIYRANGMPITCTDLSNSKYNGNIYINFSDQRNGVNNTDIWLVKSSDKGETWSKPIKVNNDSTSTHQFLSWMAIDQTNGYIYIIFYDRRNYTDNNTDVYLAISSNGGESFKNLKISESPFNPNSTIFFGDYTNISVYYNVIRPIWTRLDNNNLSILTAIIDTSDINLELIQPKKEKNILAVDVSINPNPFIKDTFVSYKLHKNSNVKIVINDIYGNNITTLKNQFLKKGKYIDKISASKNNLKSGLYIVRIILNNQTIINKKIIIN